MKRQKKAGIITIYGEMNYGNRLQNYAVTQVLRNIGYDAETIVPRIQSNSKKAVIKKKLLVLGALIFKNFLLQKHINLYRMSRFQRFTNRYIPTRYVDTPNGKMPDEIASAYDIFVVGSDQVWNPTIDGNDRILDIMLLQFADDEQKYCCSPSFGVSELPKEYETQFQQGLQSFKRLNVREAAGVEIIHRLTGREDAAVTIDPTLMIDAADWMNVAEKVKNLPNKFVLDYFLAGVPNTGAYYSLSNGMEHIKLLDRSDKKFFVASPAEFIYLISRAEIVCTDSFHACVFSILFEKPFMVFKRQDDTLDMFSRIETLLSLFGKNVKDCVGKITRIDPVYRDKVLAEKRKEFLGFFDKKI